MSESTQERIRAEANRLGNDLMLISVLVCVVAWLVPLALTHLEEIEKHARAERNLRLEAEEDRDKAKHDLDGALGKIHELTNGTDTTASGD